MPHYIKGRKRRNAKILPLALSGLTRGLDLNSFLYLHSHFLGLLLHMLNDFIASTSVISSSGRTMFFPFFQTNPAKVILALQKKHVQKNMCKHISPCWYANHFPILS